MSKITLTNLTNLQNETTAVGIINSNDAIVQAAFDNTLSRDGTQPNQMAAPIDMNSNRILNLPTPSTSAEPALAGQLNAAVIGKGNVPIGGSTGQFLTKNSSTDFDTAWITETPNLTAGLNIVVTAPSTIATLPNPSFTQVNKVIITPPATSSTLTIANGATLSAPSTATVSGTNTGDQTITLTGDATGSGSGSFATTIANNVVTNAKAAQMPAFTLKANSTGSTANAVDMDVTALTAKPSPVAGDIVLIQDSAASNAFKKTTVGALSGSTGVSSFNTRTGAVVPVLGDYTVPLGGTGTNNLTGYYAGLQPLKLGLAIIAVNPGSWANSSGTAIFSSNQVLPANLAVTNIDFTSNPATGAMCSGAMSISGSGTDKADVQLYLVHRNSDGKVALGCSTSNVYASSQTATITINSPGVITTPLAHGLFLNNTVYFTTTGALPTGLLPNTPYFVKTIPSATTFTLATTYGGTIINTTGTQSGTHTVKWGIQADLDVSLGAGVATADRRVHFAFRWKWEWITGTGGIPDFTADPRGDTVWLTDAGNDAAWQLLSLGVATTFTSVDVSPWLSNLNRIIKVRAAVTSTGSAGSAFIKAPGVTSGGIVLGEGPTSGVTTIYGNADVQTDSNGTIQYEVTGGAKLTLYVVGWAFVDPS